MGEAGMTEDQCEHESYEVQRDGSALCADCREQVADAGANEVEPDGIAVVTITFKYPVNLVHYPDNVTTVAQAVEFDAGELGDDPTEYLMMAADPDFTIEAKVKE